jgi:predicted permease
VSREANASQFFLKILPPALLFEFVNEESLSEGEESFLSGIYYLYPGLTLASSFISAGPWFLTDLLSKKKKLH